MDSRVTILCPLRLEAKPLRSIASDQHWDVRVIGLGEAATTRVVEALDTTGPVILAGTAGALRRDLPSGSAHLVREVWSSTGVLVSPLADEGLRVTGADTVIATPQDKLDLAQRTGADLVDMESHAFARVAQDRGLSWGIVRGVSDAVEDHMPANAHRWFTTEGGIRPLRAGFDLLRKPVDIPRLRAFTRRGASAMQAVRAILKARYGADAVLVE